MTGEAAPAQETATAVGPFYEAAAQRAKELDEKHAGDDNPPRSNPSSEVWRLVERIRSR